MLITATLRNAIHYTLMGGAALATTTLNVSTARAQTDDASPLEEVIVTGSRIARPEIESPSPVQVVTSQEIKLSGAVNAEQFLNDLPQTLPGTFSSTTNNGTDGSSSVNLRGLSDERTLVLVDGTRFIPKDETGVPDLNAVPIGLIERTEVLTGGASAVYGSDAMAGVVNMILKKDFEGLQLDGQYGKTTHGDGASTDISLLLGGNFADNRGNITAYANYTQRRAIVQSQRAFSAYALRSNSDLSGLMRAGSQVSFPPNVLVAGTETGDLDGDGVMGFGPNGELVEPAWDYNYGATNYLQTPQTKFVLGALGHYQINDHAEAYARMVYANNHTTEQLAPSGTFFDTYTVNEDNPYVPAATYASLVAANDGDNGDGTVDFYPGFRTVDVGNRIEDFKRSAFQIQTGLRGSIAGDWKYDVFVQRSQTEFTDEYLNDISASRLQQALLAVDDGTGNVVCIDASGGCVPANIFSSTPGALTAAAANFIKLDMLARDTTIETIVGGNATGNLGGLTIPTANSPVKVSAGFEYREASADYSPDDNLKIGNGVGFGNSPAIQGSFNVKELFAESNIPIVWNKPGAYSLSADIGYRWSDYSNKAGKVDTYMAGLAWAPIADVKLRAMYQRAVRAPSLYELFQPQTESAESATDPCAGTTPTASQALCEATGVPSGRYGSVPSPPGGQIQGILGGNPDLKAEKSDTYTFGFVLQPRGLPDFSATVDYYDIKIEDAIDEFGGSPQNLIDLCYSGVQNAASPYCQAIQRNTATGALFGNSAAVFVINKNIASLHTSGIDVGANYHLQTSAMPGSFDFSFAGTYVLSNKQQSDPVSPNLDCVGTFGLTCGEPDPQFRFTLRTTYNIKALTASLRLRYLDSVRLDDLKFGNEIETYSTRIGSYYYLDLSGMYALTDTVQLRVGIDNLLDKDPPIIDSDIAGPTNNGSGNTFPATYDSLGRFAYAGVTLKF